MLPVSSLYEQILATEGHIKTYRCLIQNNSNQDIEYTGSNLVSLRISADLFTDDTISVGGVCSAKIELEIKPKENETIKRAAKIQVFARLETDSLQSEWVPQGIYFIYSRDKDPENSNIKIIAYDAMLKADTFLLDVGQSLTGWPKNMATLVNDICTYMDVTLESGTIISDSLLCEADYSMTRRDYLSAIAKAHAGNWIITYTGELRLVGIFNEYEVLSTEDYIPITFGGTRILV